MLVIVALPFVGGGGPGLTGLAVADPSVAAAPMLASVIAAEQSQPADQAALRYSGSDQVVEARIVAESKSLTSDWEHLAQKPVPKPLPPVDAAGAASGTNERRAALEAQGLSCPGFSAGGTSGAPGAVSALGEGAGSSDGEGVDAAALVLVTGLVSGSRVATVASRREQPRLSAKRMNTARVIDPP